MDMSWEVRTDLTCMINIFKNKLEKAQNSTTLSPSEKREEIRKYNSFIRSLQFVKDGN